MEREAGTGEDRVRLRESGRRIYRAAPDDFIEQRDRVARQIRDEGDGDLAREIGRLRKPTLPAWAVDQLALRDGGEVARLFEPGDAARGTIEGDDRPVREVMAEIRQTVADLRDRAGSYLDDVGAARETHLDDVERTLTTAAVDPGRRADVVAGMLTRPLPASGFAALSGLEFGAPDSAGDGADDHDRSGRRRRRLQEERRRLERQAARLRERCEDAERRATDLRERADEAQRVVAERAAELAEAEDRLGDVIDELDVG